MMGIPLTQNQVAIVDDKDFWKFGHLNWHAHWSKKSGDFYAARSGWKNGRQQKKVSLHRAIMGNPRGKMVDHRNHNTLDCRRKNLRVCTNSQNQANRKGPARNSSSGVRGVHRSTRGYWQVQFRINGKDVWVGRFKTKQSASTASRAARQKYFGEFKGN